MKIQPLPLVQIPNTVLIQPAKTVIKFDESLHALIESMKYTLKTSKNPKGVGLAAVQVGVSLRLFLTKPTERSEIRVFINPEILSKEQPCSHKKEHHDALEGCLSIPNVWGHVERSGALTLAYQDENGSHHTETFDGFLATIIQHETDHCNGVLFTKRVVEQNGKLFQITKDRSGKEVLEELSLL